MNVIKINLKGKRTMTQEEASEFREWLKEVKRCAERVIYQLVDLNKALQLASSNLQNILNTLDADREQHNQDKPEAPQVAAG